MPTGFEHDLSELLHTVTPEPPKHLASPRLAGLLETTPDNDDAPVIELTARGEHPRRRERWWQSVAAAAVVVALVAASVVAGFEIGSRQPEPHQSTVAGRTTPTTTSSPATDATVPPCTNDQLTISQVAVRPGDGLFAIDGGTGITRFSYSNSSAKGCTLTLSSVAIGNGQSGVTAIPGSGATVRILGHGRVVFTAHVRIAGRCRTVQNGLDIVINRGPWTYSWGLGVAGCRLTRLRLTHRVVA